MIMDNKCPCELILKIGGSEYEEVSTAITSLFHSCSITDQNFFFIERQTQPTSYFGSFTAQSSNSKIPIQCQSLSCGIFLSEDILEKNEKKNFFKSTHTWNFHHKIELLDEYKQIIARQDYYELSHSLPLWSISHIPYNRNLIIRFNIFTKNFDLMLTFYKHLFQRKPDSSKTGFAVFNLSSSITNKMFYQFSIKHSPSIKPYTVSQGAYLKFRLTNLNYFVHEYTSKLFTINKYEYYIYDPDGNLLNLHLNNQSSNIKECNGLKSSTQTNDSGFGDTSDPSTQLLDSTLSQIYPTANDIDGQSYSSNDSTQYSSISSSSEVNTKVTAIHHNNINSKNNISVRPANKREIHYRLKQQQRTVFPYESVQNQTWKTSLYESEPRLSNLMSYNNRYYSSMNNIKTTSRTGSFAANHWKSTILKNLTNDDNDTSYGVDSPRIEVKTSTNSSTYGYLNAFLLKKQQQALLSQIVKENTVQIEKLNMLSSRSQPKSIPIIDESLFSTSKPINTILQQPIQDTTPQITDKTTQTSSKCVSYEWENINNDTSYMDDEEENLNNSFNQIETPRINIGITLDSRLRKTPVLDMLRSTTMQTDINVRRQLNRTFSLRHGNIPSARF